MQCLSLQTYIPQFFFTGLCFRSWRTSHQVGSKANKSRQSRLLWQSGLIAVLHPSPRDLASLTIPRLICPTRDSGLFSKHGRRNSIQTRHSSDHLNQRTYLSSLRTMEITWYLQVYRLLRRPHRCQRNNPTPNPPNCLSVKMLPS